MNQLFIFLMWASAAIILWWCIHLAARMDRRKFDGHHVRFILIAVSVALIGGGALGAVLNIQMSRELLIFGLAGMVFFERRKMGDRERNFYWTGSIKK